MERRTTEHPLSGVKEHPHNLGGMWVEVAVLAENLHYSETGQDMANVTIDRE